MAGKGALQRRKDKRKAMKRARREQNNRMYQEFRLAGKNSKRARSARKPKNITGHPHLLPCGNVGCMKCSHYAKIGYAKMLSRSHGTAFAKMSLEKRGFLVELVD